MYRKKAITAIILFAMLLGIGDTLTQLVETQLPGLSPEQAAALAVNEITPTERGFLLSNPRHSASFTKAGIQFLAEPGPVWAWQLRFAGSTAGAPLAAVTTESVAPRMDGPGTVAFARGLLTEQYVAHTASVEQQFVLHRPPQLEGADLVIAGTVTSNGSFAATAGGWIWQRPSGVVSLGDVYVFDANGQEITATMRVQADETRIVVDGSALAQAAYPVTIDPEIGTDFRISSAGPDGNANYDAFAAAVAYNSTNDEYLVVWAGESSSQVNEIEIFGQRIDAATGGEVGNDDFQISSMGSAGDTQLAAQTPAVTYNSASNEYLVVWSGDDGVNNEFEIYGQRIYGDRASGDEAGTDDFRLSDMGPDGNTDYAARYPDVAYNSTSNEYLVVWAGDDDTAPLVNGEFEIFGQRVFGDLANGDETGTDFRLSDMGTDGSTAFAAERPSVAYNSINNEYLVVWAGDDNTAPLVDGEYEIFGQRVNAATGAENGADFRLSDMGPDGNIAYAALRPDVAYNSAFNEYLVVWMGDDDTGLLADDEFEIFGQRVDGASGGETNSDFRLSDMGTGDGNSNFIAHNPQVAYNGFAGLYLVVWRGDDDTAPLVNNEYEIFGQEVYGDASAGDEYNADFRLSDMGNTDGDTAYYADHAAIAASSVDVSYLIVWQGDDNNAGLADDEVEIYGQKYDTDAVAVAPVLTITNSAGTTATLNWTTSLFNCSYDVYRSTAPYSGHTYLATVTTEPYIDPAVTGDTTTNYYYFVRANSCGGSSTADSNEVGEFDFPIVPGS